MTTHRLELAAEIEAAFTSSDCRSFVLRGAQLDWVANALVESHKLKTEVERLRDELEQSQIEKATVIIENKKLRAALIKARRQIESVAVAPVDTDWRPQPSRMLSAYSKLTASCNGSARLELETDMTIPAFADKFAYIDRPAVERLTKELLACVKQHYDRRPTARATAQEVLNATAIVVACIIAAARECGDEDEAHALFDLALRQQLQEDGSIFSKEHLS